MRKIMAIILTLVLILAGTAALADSIHSTLSAIVTYVDTTSPSDSLVYKIVGTMPLEGVYCMCSEDAVVIEYYDGSSVYQYADIPSEGNSVQADTAAIFAMLELGDVMPSTYVYCYINAESGKFALYNPTVPDSVTGDGSFNDYNSFNAYILAN